MKAFIKPSLSKLFLFLTLFVFLPWPYQVYQTPMFRSIFVFFGPHTMAKIIEPLLESDWGRLSSNNMLYDILPTSILFLVICYLLACLASYKLIGFRTTKLKSVVYVSLFLITLILASALIFSQSHGFINENMINFAFIVSLGVPGFVYIFMSLMFYLKRNKN